MKQACLRLYDYSRMNGKLPRYKKYRGCVYVGKSGSNKCVYQSTRWGSPNGSTPSPMELHQWEKSTQLLNQSCYFKIIHDIGYPTQVCHNVFSFILA